jgi:hypothetical protein
MVRRREQQRRHSDRHPEHRDQHAGGRARSDSTPLTAELGAPAFAQPLGQGGTLRSPAVNRRGGQPQRGEHQQPRQQRPAELRRPVKSRADARQAEHGQR